MLTKKETQDWIDKQYQDKGIATECIKLVVNYAFDMLEFKEISAYVFPDNNPSIRVLEKNGFVKTSEVNEYHPLSYRFRHSLIYIRKNKNNNYIKHNFIPISAWMCQKYTSFMIRRI